MDRDSLQKIAEKMSASRSRELPVEQVEYQTPGVLRTRAGSTGARESVLSLPSGSRGGVPSAVSPACAVNGGARVGWR